MHVVFHSSWSNFGRRSLVVARLSITLGSGETPRRLGQDAPRQFKLKLRNTSKEVTTAGNTRRSGRGSFGGQFRCVKGGGGGRGVPWATPRCRRTRRSRIPGAARILAEQRNPRPIPLLCPLSPITTSDTHKHRENSSCPQRRGG